MEENIWIWLCAIIIFVLTMLTIYTATFSIKKLNSEKVENIQGPVFFVSKVEKHNDLIAKYTIENNFSNGYDGGVTLNKFVFFDTKGKYNVGDYLKFTKIVSV